MWMKRCTAYAPCRPFATRPSTARVTARRWNPPSTPPCAALRRTRTSAVLTGMVMLLTFSAISIVLWVGGHNVLAGRLTGGQLSAFVFYAVLVAGSVGALSEVVGDLLRAAGAAERLLELLTTEPRIAAPLKGKGDTTLIRELLAQKPGVISCIAATAWTMLQTVQRVTGTSD